MFFVEHQCFWFQKTQVKKHQFLVKRGVATKRFFLITCVLKNAKSYRFFFPFFGQILVDVQKHCKICVSAHFQKQKKEKMTIFQSYYLGQVNVIIWAKFVAT